MARINLAQYAARLTEELARTYAVDPAHLTLETALEAVCVGLETAPPAASCCTNC